MAILSVSFGSIMLPPWGQAPIEQAPGMFRAEPDMGFLSSETANRIPPETGGSAEWDRVSGP